ncbi:hypothetical protein [Natronosalvus rutilus]|uniref:Uncharacterized protein n=1 Tax=Natronosalvus rutilus TaxID=2953753 RepID=A0A9E7N998_9EURY|nr:hypothetical protein [Natronosalvus rutilus]UTF52733.1 hypothetical protein NGM29_13200 [Natronosalvus rutilus]
MSTSQALRELRELRRELRRIRSEKREVRKEYVDSEDGEIIDDLNALAREEGQILHQIQELRKKESENPDRKERISNMSFRGQRVSKGKRRKRRKSDS